MSVGPFNTRITQNSISGTLLSQLSSTTNDLFVTQQQLATGRKILRPHMDSAGATTWLGLESRNVRNQSYIQNVSDIRSTYNFIDGQLGEAVDILNSLKQIALRESNDGGSDTESRSLSVTEVNSLREALLGIANSEVAGKSLFSGKNTKAQAFSSFGQALVYNGTQDVNKQFIGDNFEFNTTLSGHEIFGQLQALSASRQDLNPALDAALISPPGQARVSTPLTALNGGSGVDLGILKVQILPDGSGNPASGRTYEVDLRQAKSMADVLEAFSNVQGDDGQPVFDASTYQGGATHFPQNQSNKLTGLRVSARGEAAQLISGKSAATLNFISEPGKTTARDLGLVTGQLSYAFTTPATSNPFAASNLQTFNTGPYNFDLEINGQSMSLSVNPTGAQDLADFSAELESAINSALGSAGISGFSLAISTADADGDGVEEITFTLQDSAGTGSFSLQPASGASPETVAIAQAIETSQISSGLAFSQASGDFSSGVFAGRDLDPSLSLNTSLQILGGAEGIRLEKNGVGTTIAPQGIRIENGSLSADIDLSDILNDPDKTLGDLFNRINSAGLQVSARIAESGDRIEIVSNLTGVALKVQNLNGTIATQLGIDDQFSDMRIQDLNGGRGVALNDGPDFQALTSTGVEVEFDLGNPQSVEDLVDAINLNTDNKLPDGTQAFTAQAVMERTFASGDLSAQLAAGLHTFEVSLNGREPQTIELNGPFASLDALANAMEGALRDLSRTSGLSGYSVRVDTDDFNNRLTFEVQDQNGPAEIDFVGGSTSAFGLDGTSDGQGIHSFHAEVSQQRFILHDNTFDPATYQVGDPTPTLQNLGSTSVLEDLGLTSSDAIRRQFIGQVPAVGSFPTLAGLQFDLQLPRGGSAITVNIPAGSSLEDTAIAIENTVNAQIPVLGIEGLSFAARVDSQNGNLILEVSDGLGDGQLQLSNPVPGNSLTDLGLDNLTDNGAAPLVFNFGRGSFEGKAHEARGQVANNIFTYINDLIQALEQDAPSSIASTFDGLESSLNQTLQARSEAGSRVRRLDLAENRIELENDQLRTIQAQVMDTDLAEAATRLAQQETLFQAGIQATSRILRISVLDYL